MGWLPVRLAFCSFSQGQIAELKRAGLSPSRFRLSQPSVVAVCLKYQHICNDFIRKKNGKMQRKEIKNYFDTIRLFYSENKL